MKIYLHQLQQMPEIDKLIIHSLEQRLYQASICILGQEFCLWESEQRPYRTHSLTEMQKFLSQFPASAMVLRHESPYDEMIGIDTIAGQNRLEVPLSKTINEQV